MFEKPEAQDDTPERDAGAESVYSVVDRTQATIQFQRDGTIVTANDNFLATLVYGLDEIEGTRHAMFVDADCVNRSAYAQLLGASRSG